MEKTKIWGILGESVGEHAVLTSAGKRKEVGRVNRTRDSDKVPSRLEFTSSTLNDVSQLVCGVCSFFRSGV